MNKELFKKFHDPFGSTSDITQICSKVNQYNRDKMISYLGAILV